MNITICTKSALFGIALGALSVAAVWYADTLRGYADITSSLLATAACESTGFTTIQFVDGSQFTRVPVEQMPPTTRTEATARKARRTPRQP